MSLERECVIVDYDPTALAIPKMAEAIQRSVIMPRLRRVIGRTPRPRRGRQAR